MKARSAMLEMSHRKRLVGTALAATAAAALAWTGIAGVGAPAAHGAGTGAESGAGTGSVTAVADAAPGYAVEDFAYPGAAKILAEQNIVLKRGDGHITLATCASDTGQLEVWARDKDKICFKVTGNSGRLTLEIPSVYAVRGNDYTTAVDMTVGTEAKSFDVAKNAWTPVGESADEQGREFMLVEIRTAK